MSNHRCPSTSPWRQLPPMTLWLAVLLSPLAASAQPPPAEPPAAPAPADGANPPAAAESPTPAPGSRQCGQCGLSISDVGSAGADDEPVELSKDPLAAALRPSPGGLTPERVALRAVDTSPAVAAKRAQVAAAAAKLDQAFVAYFPRVTTAFTYTRLSEVENALDVGIDIPGMDTSGFSFPVILNSWSWTTQLAVPFSDYLLRLTQAYAAASQTKEARRLEAHAEALKAGADAKVAFLDWVRAKGARAVTKMAVESTSAHVDDARFTLEAGLLSRADLLALESQLANAENLTHRAEAFERVSAERVRLSIHAKPGTALTLGIDVIGEPPAVSQRPVDELQQRALAQRLELRALAATKRSLEELRSVTRAGLFPRLDGFANLNYANPNQRIFPQAEKWDWTWELGVRASWTINETFSTLGADAEVEANLRAIDHQRRALEDGIKLSVAASYYDLAQASSAIAAARRSETAATESLRVRRDRFRLGKATSTDIIDAETAVTQARLSRINAHVDLLKARAQLAYAMGQGASRALAQGE